MRVLGIESSCDETGIAVYETDQGITADAVFCQADTHTKYGGVVPELASRDHIRKVLPMIRDVLGRINSTPKELDGVAYTLGPGLAGALLVGAGIGRSLAWALNLPAIGVHHMEAHLLAPLLDHQTPRFPLLVLLVSGGHTMLVRVEKFGIYEILGQSLDDAAGEAFDKVAKLLDLGYPGGPRVAQIAQNGNPIRFAFPRPMLNHPGFDFSFSGLKTAVMLQVRQLGTLTEQDRQDVARGFEEAVVETLAVKCQRALTTTGCKTLILSGGVAANVRLRSTLSSLDAQVIYPPIHLCVDNGAMVALAGHMRLQAGCRSPLSFQVKPRWPLSQLTPEMPSEKSRKRLVV